MKLTKVESCCGSVSYILNLKNPIKKKHIQSFKEAGYVSLDNFLKYGTLYIQKKGIIITGVLNTTRVQIKTSDESLIEEFKEVLKKVFVESG